MFGTVTGFSRRPIGKPVIDTEYDLVNVRLDNGCDEEYMLLNFSWGDIQMLRVGDRVTALLSETAFAVDCYRGEVVRPRLRAYPNEQPKESIDWRKEGW